VDNFAVPALLFGMDQPEEEKSMTKFTTPLSLVVDLVLVVLFSIYMYSVLSTHVPSNDPKMILIWGLIGTSCMTGVFWLALQMFRVVFRAHRASRQ
jgi:hypothetical protein